MKIVAAVFADFLETFLGAPARLGDRLGSRTVLGHTLARVAKIAGVERRCLFVRPRDEAAGRSALAACGLESAIDLLPLDDVVRRRRRLFRCARKWNLAGWRGAPLGATWFDEYVEPAAVARVLDHYQAEAVLCLDGHQALLDPGLATRMVGQQRESAAEAEFLFTQAPPGLAGVILRRGFVRELLESDCPFGLALSYRPEAPRMDLITKPQCLSLPGEIVEAHLRLVPDTVRSFELIEAGLGALGEEADAAQWSAWGSAGARDVAGGLPVELELELTTDDPLPDSALRPRGARGPVARRLADVTILDRVAAEMARYDDRQVVLGGHGDPLFYPHFAQACARLRAAGPRLAIAVTTPLVELSSANAEALLDHQVDVIEVLLDADTSGTYRAVHGRDAFDAVLANIERIQQLRRQRTSPEPLVLCSMTRCAATLAEQEAFYDRWIRATGWAVLRGYNDYCVRLGEDSLLSLEPPNRGPCRRIERRMTLLADGRAVTCAQDVDGRQCVGRWDSESIASIWRGTALAGIRQAHADGGHGQLPLCGRCREWHRG